MLASLYAHILNTSLAPSSFADGNSSFTGGRLGGENLTGSGDVVNSAAEVMAAELAVEELAVAAGEMLAVLETVNALSTADAQEVTEALSGLLGAASLSRGSPIFRNLARDLDAAMGQIARAVASAVTLDSNGTSPRSLVLSSPNLNASIAVRSLDALSRHSIECESDTEALVRAVMPAGVLANSLVDHSKPVVAILRSSSNLLHPRPEAPSGSIGANTSTSAVVTFTLLQDGTSLKVQSLSTPINISMPHAAQPGQACIGAPQDAEAAASCVTTVECRFWNETESSWSTAGCATTSDASGSVGCSCTHLTAFIAFTFPTSTDELAAIALTTIAMNKLTARAFECAFNPQRSLSTVPVIWGCNVFLLSLYVLLLGNAIFQDRREIALVKGLVEGRRRDREHREALRRRQESYKGFVRATSGTIKSIGRMPSGLPAQTRRTLVGNRGRNVIFNDSRRRGLIIPTAERGRAARVSPAPIDLPSPPASPPPRPTRTMVPLPRAAPITMPAAATTAAAPVPVPVLSEGVPGAVRTDGVKAATQASATRLQASWRRVRAVRALRREAEECEAVVQLQAHFRRWNARHLWQGARQGRIEHTSAMRLQRAWCQHAGHHPRADSCADPNSGPRAIHGGSSDVKPGPTALARWQQAKKATQKDVRSAQLTRAWHFDVDRVWKRLWMALTMNHTLCAGVLFRGVPGYTRAQTVMVLINSFAFELVLLCLFYSPPEPVVEGEPAVTIDPVALVMGATFAAAITIPVMVAFTWLYDPIIFVRFGRWCFRAFLCWPCWLGATCFSSRARRKQQPRTAQGPAREDEHEHAFALPSPPPSPSAVPSWDGVPAWGEDDEEEGSPKAQAATPVSWAMQLDDGARRRKTPPAGDGERTRTATPVSEASTSRTTTPVQGEEDEATHTARPASPVYADDAVCEGEAPVAREEMFVSYESLNEGMLKASLTASWEREDWPAVRKILFGWSTNHALFLVMLLVFNLYGCQLFEPLERDEEHVGASVGGGGGAGVGGRRRGGGSRKVAEGGNVDELVIQWALSAGQRFLLHEPTLILAAKGLPILFATAFCTNCCGETIVNLLSVVFEIVSAWVQQLKA